MKTALIKTLIALHVFNPHYVAFTWHDNVPGAAKILCGTTSGGPYSLLACQTSKENCNSHKLASGMAYFCVATQNGIDNSNEVTFTTK